MFKNYFKIAWRNLLKNRTFSLINIVGLSFSVAFCLLLFLYIRYEQSYDAFHVKKDRLFRLEMTSTYSVQDTTAKKSMFSFFTKSDNVQNQLVFPLVVAGNMQSQFPEVKSITRFQDAGDQLVKVNNQVYKEAHIVFTDTNFFSNFSFPLLQGNAKTVLNAVNNVVLSQSTAKKYFGKENPIGKTIELISDSPHPYVVSGIVQDAPRNSSIQDNIVVPVQSDPGYQENISQGFNQSSHFYIVELADHVDYKAFEAKMNKWVTGYYTRPFIAQYGQYYKDFDFSKFRWYLRPLKDAHYNTSPNWGHYTDANKMYQLACLVIIILLIASLNYVLLVVSNAAARSQEIGVRKVLGARRSSVIMQFWIETLIVVLIAIVLGFFLMQSLLPIFNSVMNTEIHISSFSFTDIVPPLVLLALLLSLIAGYYPAWLLSKLKPSSIIKSFQTFKVNPRFSKVLVVVQYTSCVVLMIAAYVINEQMQFISNKELGFDKDQILMVRNPTWDADFTKHTHEQLQAFTRSQPSILQFSGMNGGLDGSYNTNGFVLNGVQTWRKELTVDYNYFEMLNIPFVQGRPFSTNFPTDTASKKKPIIVNETLFAMLGKEAKVGEYNDALNGTIIGVVKDYNFETLSKKIEPEEHRLANGYEMYFMFKIRAGDMQPVISKLQKEWKSITGNYPFEYTFLDQSIAKMYEADMQWQKIIQAACFFAIFIACLGLFGLSAINAVNRTKEIGIRKVLGATITDIVTTLSSGFVIMFLIAIVIAVPLAYWIMSNWLQDFAYRINMNWFIFFASGMLALSIAFITVSVQAIKAGMANPVKSLRTE